MTGRVCACSDLVHINVATGAVSVDDHDDNDRDRQQGGHQQGGQQQGGHQQGGHQQGGYQQGSHQQGGHDQGGYQPGGHQQGGYQQGSHQQGGHEQGGHQQGGYQQGSHQQGGHEQGGYQQGGHQQGGHQQGAAEIQLLETGAIGGDYVQLRWRYDGPKPVKYMITYKGHQRDETQDGHSEEAEVDSGAPIEVEVEHYVVHGLRPDTVYTFEVTVVDQATGRPSSRPQTIRVTTKAYIL